jgi:hypothetical protein
VANFIPGSIYLRERTPVPIKQEGGWVTGTVWAFWRREKSLARAGIRNPDHPARGLFSILDYIIPVPFTPGTNNLKQMSLGGNCNT